MPAPSPPPVSPAEVTWIPASNGQVPAGAVAGGFESNGTALYICRVNQYGGQHVGKIVGRNCNFGYGGSEITASVYEVLVGHWSRWVASTNGAIPDGAIQGGREADGTPLYVCRATYGGGTHVGNVVGRHCNFGWGGQEVLASRYEVLVR